MPKGTSTLLRRPVLKKRAHGIPGPTDLTVYAVFRFWLPLALTWMLMSGAQPVMAGIVARLPEPVENLAAFGLGFSMAQFLEFPIIMLLSAATRLVHDRASYERLRVFALVACGGVGLIGLLLSATPALGWIATHVIGVPEALHDRVAACGLALVPWPVCIGYRRFVQGVLIREGRTELVGYGTMVRVATVIVCGLFLGLVMELPGALAGAFSLSASVMAEACITLYLGRGVIRRLKQRDTGAPPSYGSIFVFYYPLALTSLLSIATAPLVALFLGQSRMGIESLAAYPVVIGVIQVFRGVAQSYQEIIIALRGENGEGDAMLRRFAHILGWSIAGSLTVIGFTPLGAHLFRDIGGLNAELAGIALPAFQIAIPYAAGSVLYHWQRAILVHRRSTLPITVATAVEIGFTAITLFVGIHMLHMIGVQAAALSLLVGRWISILYLIPSTRPRGQPIPQ